MINCRNCWNRRSRSGSWNCRSCKRLVLELERKLGILLGRIRQNRIRGSFLIYIQCYIESQLFVVQDACKFQVAAEIFRIEGSGSRRTGNGNERGGIVDRILAIDSRHTVRVVARFDDELVFAVGEGSRQEVPVGVQRPRILDAQIPPLGGRIRNGFPRARKSARRRIFHGNSNRFQGGFVGYVAGDDEVAPKGFRIHRRIRYPHRRGFGVYGVSKTDFACDHRS